MEREGGVSQRNHLHEQPENRDREREQVLERDGEI